MTRLDFKLTSNSFKTSINQVQAGFSLIELMISITIGLMLMAGILMLFLNTSRTNTEMAKTNAQIESGRFAIQLLQNDIAHGGFWNGYVPEFDDMTATAVPSNVPLTVPDPCLSYSTPWDATYKTDLLSIPIQAYDDVPLGCTGVVLDKQADTDVVVVRHADTTTCQPDLGTCTANELYFQSSFCSTASNYDYVLDTAGFNLLRRDCTTQAPARKFVSNIYYIRDYAITEGDGIPTLVRSQFGLTGGVLEQQDVEALIEGIEGFNIELGVDNVSDSGDPVDYTAAVEWDDPSDKISPTNRGDGAPDEFIRCTTAAPCTASELINVVTVKLYVLVRNVETTTGYTDSKTYNLGSVTLGPFNDSYKRHLYSTSIRLHNVSGRRETP